ncbi:pyridoxal-dependent decarboxylase [Geitlerinema splendidum]|jgi:glutamate/tyrosine decarboxylase-like PLP-dependent enzyme|nr:pyridoxal-dependent decarboxylase [Geitlerinema splendidum]
MKCFQQVLLISTCLLVSMQSSAGMSEERELFYAPPPRDPLPRSRAKETSQDTLNIAQEIRSRIQSQIDKEERAARKPICVDALFLGPHGENADLLLSFVKEALNDHLYWRRSFHPEDPFRITEEIKRSSDFLTVKDSLSKQLRLLLAELKKYSIPLYSMRHLGHMFGEQTLPSLVGYIATLFYNPNNVAFEGGPVTTCLEEQVAKDLCQMVGYRIADVRAADSSDPIPTSWGHLTGGGTIANTEALWAARNVKFFPFSVQQALKKEASLQGIEVIVTLPGREEPVKLIDVSDPWNLLNIGADEALKLPERIFSLLPNKPEREEKIMSFSELYALLSKYSIQEIGLLGVYELLNDGILIDKRVRSPVVLTSTTRHYSFPKALSLLGLGEGNLIDIPVDENARIDLGVLETKLRECILKRRPVIAVAAIIGSTEEGAIDPLHNILQMREAFRSEGIDFHIHADAAWGGYFATLLPKRQDSLVPILNLSQHATTQLTALKEADSVTIDPHKSGYMPYPAAALCYRNKDIINMVNFTAPYLSAQEKTKEPNLGVYGIEGSKPGASAAMVYLTHRVIPLDKDGYGILLGQALYSTQEFCKQLMALNTGNGLFVVKPLLQHYSDLNIVTYAFNFYEPSGSLNSDLGRTNEFNQAIYKHLRPQFKKPTSELNLVVSNTSLEKSKYGELILGNFLEQLGVTVPSTSDHPNPDYTITTLRSVIMNPWITETEEGSFVGTIMKVLTDTITSVRSEMSMNSLASTSNNPPCSSS